MKRFNHALSSVLVFSLALAGCDDSPRDMRETAFRQDSLHLASGKATGDVPFSTGLRDYLLENASVEGRSGANQALGDIGVHSKVEGKKILILIQYPDLKKIEKSTRGVLFELVEDYLQKSGHAGKQAYIAVKGRILIGMIKTPGFTAVTALQSDDNKLLEFYGPQAVYPEATGAENAAR